MWIRHFEQKKPFIVGSLAKVIIMNVKYVRIRKNGLFSVPLALKKTFRNMAGDLLQNT
jgi:hypothetical protein